ncbi:MAG: hypothetical protein AB7G09_26665 [Pseudonocardia sp.]
MSEQPGSPGGRGQRPGQQRRPRPRAGYFNPVPPALANNAQVLATPATARPRLRALLHTRALQRNDQVLAPGQADVAHLPDRPAGLHPDDLAFLDELWQGLDRDMRFEPARAVAEIDRMFRHSDKPDSGVQTYLAALRLEFGQLPDDWRGAVRLPVGSVAEWIDGGRCATSSDDWMFVHGRGGRILWRVYVNAATDHAPAVFKHLCTAILSEPDPAGCKLGSYPIASTGRDCIVAYLGSTAGRDRIAQTMLDYTRHHQGHVGPQSVRFTVRQTPGISYAPDPPPALAEWVRVTEEHLRAQWGEGDLAELARRDGRDWDDNTRNDSVARRFFMSYSELVVAVIAYAWKLADTRADFLRLLAIAFTDIGLDLRTGTLAPPSAAAASWLIDRFCPIEGPPEPAPDGDPSDDEDG